MNPTGRTQPGSGMQDCIAACAECAKVCLQTLGSHCLIKGKEHTDAEHVKLLLDCADICRTSADFMSRGSDYHHVTCGACAQICTACAQSCELIGDELMKQCAQVCRKCAESCRVMSHGNVRLAVRAADASRDQTTHPDTRRHLSGF